MPRANCMVCHKRPAIALYRDPRGWHLIGCGDDRCIQPPMTEPYEWVMSYEDFLACRRMLAAQRHKLVGGDDKFHPVTHSAITPRWDPNR